MPESPKIKIGSSARMNLSKRGNVSPGPGSYNPLDSNQNMTSKFGTSSRKTFQNETLAPGPGTYENKLNIGQGPHYSISGRMAKSGSAQNLPGPGQYELNTYEKVVPKSPQFSMGSSKRNDASPLKSMMNIPGPGTYNSSYSAEGPV